MTYHHGIKGVDVGYLEVILPGIEAMAGTPILADELEDDVAIVVAMRPGDMVQIVQGRYQIMISRKLWARFVAELGALGVG